tara:strand:- start:2227 stop:2487 length:261 start_codon:yes stop_codon:yes gene_type:complete
MYLNHATKLIQQRWQTFTNHTLKNKNMSDKEDKPKDPKVTQRPNTSSSWQTFNKTEKKNEPKKIKGELFLKSTKNRRRTFLRNSFI